MAAVLPAAGARLVVSELGVAVVAAVVWVALLVQRLCTPLMEVAVVVVVVGVVV